MIKSSADPHKRKSIKARYLRFALLVATIFVIGATFSGLHIKDVARSNTESLELRDSATKILGEMRQSIWRINATLNTTLITPEAGHDRDIKNDLMITEDKLTELSHLKSIESAGLTNITSDLKTDLDNLKFYLYLLLENIKDPNWIYPMLPYINETLLESNIAFESATTYALQEIASDDGNEYASELYRDVAQIRDLWRQQILNFRASIIRFAGLNRVKPIPQEQNIVMINTEVIAKLHKLELKQKKGLLGFETEDALNIMQHHAKKWLDDFRELKKIRDSEIWRNDIYFIDNIIRPMQTDIANDLGTLEDSMLRWSSKNTIAVENIANQLNLQLWGLTAFAMAFVWFIYFMIARAVLTPIAQISKAITNDINKIDSIPSLENSSQEVHSLITAFNTMRSHIHHRQLALEHQALHDSLTGLPNRALLNDRLEQAINIARRQHTNVAVMLLDLDRFKDINDTLGHPVGDLVLQEIGSRLEACLRASDTVARLGGDEFAIICPNIETSETTSFAEKIINSTDQVVNINDQNLYTGVSVGISLFPENADNAASLIQLADIAMYSAKQKGIGYTFYSTEMDKISVDNLSLLGNLREELKNPTGQIRLHYQPQINLKTKRIHGAEALLRWNHPEKGAIPPTDIVSMSEQTNLIDDLTLWVITQAVQDYAICNKNGMTVNISVNLSVRNLQNPELAPLIQAILTENGMDPERLTLEITESAIMNDPVRARETLNLLSSMGINLDIDDYGVGFSSLSYLKMLPVNGLKIDKSFVIDLLDDENDLTIVKSTIDLGHNLNLSVIAEGVETASVFRHLENIQCDFAQGAYIACPMPADELLRWCEAYEPDSL